MPLPKVWQNFAKAVCDGIINFRLIRLLTISVGYFCLIKDVLCCFVWFTNKYTVHLLYSFIHVY